MEPFAEQIVVPVEEKEMSTTGAILVLMACTYDGSACSEIKGSRAEFPSVEVCKSDLVEIIKSNRTPGYQIQADCLSGDDRAHWVSSNEAKFVNLDYTTTQSVSIQTNNQSGRSDNPIESSEVAKVRVTRGNASGGFTTTEYRVQRQ